jgi:hypothetical protein
MENDLGDDGVTAVVDSLQPVLAPVEGVSQITERRYTSLVPRRTPGSTASDGFTYSTSASGSARWPLALSSKPCS